MLCNNTASASQTQTQTQIYWPNKAEQNSEAFYFLQEMFCGVFAFLAYNSNK